MYEKLEKKSNTGIEKFKITEIFEDSFNIQVNGATVKINEALIGNKSAKAGGFIELEYEGNLDIESLDSTVFSQII